MPVNRHRRRCEGAVTRAKARAYYRFAETVVNDRGSRWRCKASALSEKHRAAVKVRAVAYPIPHG
jgi:hypothetical protein